MKNLIERIADLCHDQWSGWMKYLFNHSTTHLDGSVTIPSELVRRWSSQLNTPYAKLSEPEQASDRIEAKKKFLDTVFTLTQLQAEMKPWQLHNFGERPSWMPLMGAFEEIGELAHAYLKQAQGIRGTPEKHKAAKKDAVCDAIIFLADYFNSEGFGDLSEALAETWAEVKQRDFKKFPKNGRTE